MSAEVNVDFQEDELVQSYGAQHQGLERACTVLSASSKMVEGNGDGMAVTEEDLKQFRKLKQRIQLLEDKIEELEKVMVVPGCQQITGMPRGGAGDHDKIANIIARLESLKKSYVAKLDELVELWVQIEEAVESLDVDEQRIISLYYFQGCTWDDVVDITGIARRTVFRLHERAIKSLSNL